MHKSQFLREFQTETVYVHPKLCFGHMYNISAWNSHRKCHFWHCVFWRACEMLVKLHNEISRNQTCWQWLTQVCFHHVHNIWTKTIALKDTPFNAQSVLYTNGLPIDMDIAYTAGKQTDGQLIHDRYKLPHLKMTNSTGNLDLKWVFDDKNV